MSTGRDPEGLVCGHGLLQLQLSEQGSAHIRISAHKFVSTVFVSRDVLMPWELHVVLALVVAPARR